MAWAAGFFDGEGTCGAYRMRDGFYTRMSIHQKDPEVLHRFRAAVGAGKLHGPYAHGKRGEPMWDWAASKYATCAEVFRLLNPYLGSIKRRQISTALALAADDLAARGGPEARARHISMALTGKPFTPERRLAVSIGRKAAAVARRGLKEASSPQIVLAELS